MTNSCQMYRHDLGAYPAGAGVFFQLHQTTKGPQDVEESLYLVDPSHTLPEEYLPLSPEVDARSELSRIPSGSTEVFVLNPQAIYDGASLSSSYFPVSEPEEYPFLQWDARTMAVLPCLTGALTDLRSRFLGIDAIEMASSFNIRLFGLTRNSQPQRRRVSSDSQDSQSSPWLLYSPERSFRLELDSDVHLSSSSEFDDFLQQYVEEQLDRMFLEAQDEKFETGVDSRFSIGLQQLYEKDAVVLLSILRERLLGSAGVPDVLAEVLQWASRLEASFCRSNSVELLLIGLHDLSPFVRDSAALGLAYLSGRVAITHLREAAEREKVPELRADMFDLIESLED